MVTKETHMHTLSKEQQQTLVEIVNEQFGVDLEYDDFVEVLLGMFEDSLASRPCPPPRRKPSSNHYGEIIMVKKPVKNVKPAKIQSLPRRRRLLLSNPLCLPSTLPPARRLNQPKRSTGTEAGSDEAGSQEA